MAFAAKGMVLGGLSPCAILNGLLRGPRRPPGALLPLPPGLLVSFTSGSAPAHAVYGKCEHSKLCFPSPCD